MSRPTSGSAPQLRSCPSGRAPTVVPYHWDGFAGNTVPPGSVVDAAAGRINVVVPARDGELAL